MVDDILSPLTCLAYSSSQLKAENEELRRTIDGLQRDLRDKTSECRDHEATIRSLQTSGSSVSSHVSELENKVQELQRQLSAEKAKNNSLMAMNEQLEEEVRQLSQGGHHESTPSVGNGDVGVLERRIKELENLNREQADTIKQLEADVASDEAAVTNLEAEVSRSTYWYFAGSPFVLDHRTGGEDSFTGGGAQIFPRRVSARTAGGHQHMKSFQFVEEKV